VASGADHLSDFVKHQPLRDVVPDGIINMSKPLAGFKPETCGVVFRCSHGFAGVRNCALTLELSFADVRSAWLPIWLPKGTRAIKKSAPMGEKPR
jgi:hypothetical protein